MIIYLSYYRYQNENIFYMLFYVCKIYNIYYNSERNLNTFKNKFKYLLKI